MKPGVFLILFTVVIGGGLLCAFFMILMPEFQKLKKAAKTPASDVPETPPAPPEPRAAYGGLLEVREDGRTTRVQTTTAGDAHIQAIQTVEEGLAELFGIIQGTDFHCLYNLNGTAVIALRDAMALKLLASAYVRRIRELQNSSVPIQEESENLNGPVTRFDLARGETA